MSFLSIRFPSSRCASTIQIVRPSQSMADTQPKLQPALLSLSAMISQYFTRPTFTAITFLLYALHGSLPVQGRSAPASRARP